MRMHLVVGLALVAMGVAATSVSANTVNVGNCAKSGACASACVDVTSGCGSALACVGISFEVPACVPGAPVSVGSASTPPVPCEQAVYAGAVAYSCTIAGSTHAGLIAPCQYCDLQTIATCQESVGGAPIVAADCPNPFFQTALP